MTKNDLNLKIKKAIDIGLKHAEKEGASHCEGYGVNLKAYSLELEKIKPKHSIGIQHGLSFRVIAHQAKGFAYTSSFGEEDIKHTVNLAIQNAKTKKTDLDLKGFPEPNEAIQKLVVDKKLLEIEAEGAADLFEEIHVKELPKDIFFLQSLGFFGIGDTFLKNSQGMDRHEQDAASGVGLAYLSTHGFPNYDFHIEGARKLGSIKTKQLGLTAIDKVLQIAKPRTLSISGEYPIIISPDGSYGIMGGLFNVLNNLLQGDKASRGETIFADKIGDQIANEKFTMIDDPLDPDMVTSTTYDGEGVPTEQTKLIENGVLQTYYLDTYYANKLNMESNGKATRGGFLGGNPVKSPPSIGSYATKIEPGDSSLDEMISETQEGFMLKNFMGIHMSDLSSGRFAVTGSGWYIKKGEIKYPVQDISISGTIPDLLLNIDMISKERTRGLMSEVPYLRVSQLSVTAKKLDFKLRFGVKVLKAMIKLGLAKNPFV